MTSKMRFSNKRWGWLCAAVIALVLLLTTLLPNGSLAPHAAQAAPLAQGQDLTEQINKIRDVLKSLGFPEPTVKTNIIANRVVSAQIEADIPGKSSVGGTRTVLTMHVRSSNAQSSAEQQASDYFDSEVREMNEGLRTRLGVDWETFTMDRGEQLTIDKGLRAFVHTANVNRAPRVLIEGVPLPTWVGVAEGAFVCGNVFAEILHMKISPQTTAEMRLEDAVNRWIPQANAEAKAGVIDWMTRLAKALLAANACKAPGGTTQPQPPAATGPFSVGHGCSYNEPPTTATGQLRCAAGTINEPPGADLFDIVFEWTYDGATVPNESKQVYARDDKDITPGEHTVTVVAIDKRTNSRSEGSTFRFTKPGADLAVTVQCALRSDQNDAVACYADPENVPEGATLTYEWTWNGAPEGETSRTLNKTNLADGLYIITVRATDSKSGKTAQGSTTVQVGTPSSGQVQVTTSAGTTTVNPGTKTQIQLRPGEKAELAARCAEIKYTLALMAAVRPEGAPSSALVWLYLMVEINCRELLSSQPLALAMAGGSNSVLLSHLSIADKPVQVQIELQQGPLRVEVVHDAVALDVETATTIVSSVGKNTLGVAHDPNTGTSIVSAYQGTVSIQPKNLALSPTTLQTGQRVEVTQSNVGAVTPISTPGSAAAGALGLVICGGVPFLMLAALIGGVVVFRRSRRRPARPPAPPPPGVPAGRPRPPDLAERGAQRIPPPGARFCSHCGAPLKGGVQFCTTCGQRVSG
jgi:hypothetical protein